MFEDVTKPLHLLTREIAPEWIDYNGHMTESRYLYAVTLASEVFLLFINARNVISGIYLLEIDKHRIDNVNTVPAVTENPKAFISRETMLRKGLNFCMKSKAYL